MNDTGIDVKSFCNEMFILIYRVMEILLEICLCGSNIGILVCGVSFEIGIMNSYCF